MDVVQTTSLMPLSAATAIPDSSFRYHFNHHLLAAYSNPTLPLPLLASGAAMVSQEIRLSAGSQSDHPGLRPPGSRSLEFQHILSSYWGLNNGVHRMQGAVSHAPLGNASLRLTDRSYHANFLRQKQMRLVVDELMECTDTKWLVQ